MVDLLMLLVRFAQRYGISTGFPKDALKFPIEHMNHFAAPSPWAKAMIPYCIGSPQVLCPQEKRS